MDWGGDRGDNISLLNRDMQFRDVVGASGSLCRWIGVVTGEFLRRDMEIPNVGGDSGSLLSTYSGVATNDKTRFDK